MHSILISLLFIGAAYGDTVTNNHGTIITKGDGPCPTGEQAVKLIMKGPEGAELVIRGERQDKKYVDVSNVNEFNDEESNANGDYYLCLPPWDDYKVFMDNYCSGGDSCDDQSVQLQTFDPDHPNDEGDCVVIHELCPAGNQETHYFNICNKCSDLVEEG